MTIKDFFSNNFETSDNNQIESLKTRYYRNRYEDVKKTIIKMIDIEKGYLKDTNDTFNEVFYDCPEYSCTATITRINPSESAVDFKITTYKLIAAGRGKKVIERLYKYLDNNLQFKGVSLYKY